MNQNLHQDESVVTEQLREALSDLATPRRPLLADITSRGSAYRRRQRAGRAGLGITGVAAATALALGVGGFLSGGTAPLRTRTAQPPAPARGASPVRAAAFILTGNADGTDTLTLTMSQLLVPEVLQKALADHGIPSLVESGEFCSSNPPPPDPVSAGVLSIQPPPGSPRPATRVASLPPASQMEEMAVRTKTVIDPAKLPAGTELFFGYSTSDRALFSDLIYTSSYTCSAGQPGS